MTLEKLKLDKKYSSCYTSFIMKGEQNMVNTGLYIPDKIKVGYQKREGTYTGKLAYVIYYDEKGKLRKEASWDSWRKHDIEPQEFDNVPTEGFVLNKKVGDYSNGWDHRQAYVRVYDPRDFEFEITVENLLYILEHCSSIKGKGLEGEFVYSWDGKDLVLLPVGTVDYKECKARTEIIQEGKFLKPSELVVGKTYETAKGEKFAYLGKHDYIDYCGWYVSDEVKVTKKFYIAQRSSNSDYIFTYSRSSLSKFFVKEVDEDKDLYEQGMKSLEKDEHVHSFDFNHIEKLYISDTELKETLKKYSELSRYQLVDIDGETFSIYIGGDYTDDKDCKFKVTVDYWDEDIRRFMSPYYRTELGRFTKFTEKVGEPIFETSYRPRYLMTFDEIMAIKPYKVQTYLCNGKPYEILRDRQYRGVQLW